MSSTLRLTSSISVSWQVRLSMLILLVLSLLIGALSYYSLQVNLDSAQRHIQQDENLMRPASHIAVMTLQCRRYEKDMLLNLQDHEVFENYFVRWSATVDSLQHAIMTYRQNAEDGQQILTAEKWLAFSEQYQKAVMNVVTDIRNGHITTPQQGNLTLAPYKNTIRSLNISSFSIFDHEFAQSRVAGLNLQDQMIASQRWIAWFIAIVLVVSIYALIMIPRQIVRPLRTLERTARLLGDGNLSARLSQDMPGNELGRLCLTFNRMAEQIEIREKELIKAKAASDSLNQAKTAFLMNMSHELRTPLTTILGFAEFLNDESMVEESMDAILRSGQHLLGIVDNLLQLTEIETSQVVLNGTTFRLNTLIDAMIEEVIPLARDKQLELVVSINNQLDFEIFSDQVRLKSVIHHLLENAIKFTEKGHVQIRCDRQENQQQIVVQIKDTGIGMHPQQLDRIGQLFSVGDDSVTRSRGGMGTGLALCKRTLECLGGKLNIISQPGTGTSVTITLPIRAEIPRAPMHIASQQSNPKHQLKQGFGHNKVLVAEDTPEIQKLIRSMLQQINIQVDVADNGQDAIDMAMRAYLNDQPYDLIIMDMQMPVMDGYTATRQLRLQGYVYPVVALTAHAMENDRQKCLDVGCDDYMKKPIDPALFTRYVRHWLENPLIRVI